MKWNALRRMLRSKLNSEVEHGGKHDGWDVYCGSSYRGRVLDSRGDGEMRGHEIGNVARSLGVSERQLRELVSCAMSREQYCTETT